MLFLAAVGLSAADTVNRYVGETAMGDGSGTSPDNRAKFIKDTHTDGRNICNDWLGETAALPDLRIHFSSQVTDPQNPGPAARYSVNGNALWILGAVNPANNSGRKVALLAYDPSDPQAATKDWYQATWNPATPKPRLFLESIQNHVNYKQRWTKSIAHHILLQSAITGNNQNNYLERIVVKDLDLDGNFQGQESWTTEANATGYKSSAISVAARSGHIKNVTVRNFGSVGQVPWHYRLLEGGVEAFPVHVHTFDEEDLGLQPLPAWVIEEVEVSDFHSVHDGYGTMIMPLVLQRTENANSASAPVTIVRRCVVRGNQYTIGLGTAGRSYPVNVTGPAFTGVISGRIRFEHNTVLNALNGFNTDTGYIGPLTFHNNAFLDVTQWGLLGQPEGGVAHQDYAFTDNLLRLRGWADRRTWANVCVNDPANYATDPNLLLGRPETFRPGSTPGAPGPEIAGRAPAGLILQGAAGPVTVTGTHYTTWRLNDFYPATPGQPPPYDQYRPIWKFLDNTAYACWIWPRIRGTVSTMALSNNRISPTSYDFAPVTALTGGTFANFNENSSAAHTDARPPVTATPTGFTPVGRLGRTKPLYNANGLLTGVREIQLGDVAYSAGTLTVKLRVVEHRLKAGDPMITTETLPVGGQVVQLRSIRQLNTWSLVGTPPSLPAWNSVTDNTSGTTAAATGIVTLQFTGLSSASGVCRLTGWFEDTANATFEPEQDYWAAHDFPLPNLSLPVVTLTAGPDVADDKNTIAAKRAKIQVTRNVADATSPALAVEVRLPRGIYRTPTSSSAPFLEALYSGNPSPDYYLASGTGTWTLTSAATANPLTGTITIPAGQKTGEIQVIPIADNKTEQNLILCRLAVSPNDAYAPGVSTNANVLIYDGPEFTLVELTGVYGPSVYGAEARAVNAGVVDSLGTWTVQPQVVGTATWQASGPETHGTLWTPTSIYPATDFGATFRPYGISHRPSLAAGDRARVVGAYVNAAWRVLDDGTGGVQLPHFTDTTGPSLAWGISPDYSRAVGYSTLAGKKKPAVWLGTATPANLAQALGSEAVGEAMAVNNAGVIVGFASGFESGSILRPFRSDGTNLDDNDDLPVPSGNGTGQANAITTVGANHHAVGWYLVGNPATKRGAYWKGDPLPSSVVNLGLLNRNGVFDLESEALGINSSQRIVGWSGASETDANRHAVLSSDGAAWVDLNDKHFTHGLDGTWTLQRANAISDHGVIVGLGTKSGSPRGFMLVPRVPGN